jgi:DNA-binding cell septation regulator SpoVG
MITITSVRVFPFDTAGTGGRVRAYAEVEINGCLIVKGIRVMQAEAGGYFLSYPSQRVRKDNFIDLIVPDREAGRLIREAVMTEFKSQTDPADTSEGR